MKTPVEKAAGRYDGTAATAHSPAHGRSLKPLARQIRLALLLGVAASEVFAAPQGGQVVAGQGQISAPDALTTRITQQSANLAIDWQSFNVKSNELVEFRQPGRNAQALNRIFDQNPSQIFGRLNANGRVLLMNPNGVVFGPGAQVNVGSLVAAGLQAKVDDFMAGRLHLEGLDGADGVVVNQGLIAAATGGDVTLAGKAVRNEGVIVATAGRVNLAAGNKVTLDFDGDGLVRFTVDEGVLDNAQALDSAISNSGSVSADGGAVMIEAKAAADVFSRAVNNAGVIRAARVDNSGGVIRLVATGPEASVLNTGTLDAAAAGSGNGGAIELNADGRTTLAGGGVVRAAGGSGGTGGEVKVLGTTVELADQARIDVSGPAGGGAALVGGDRAGANPGVRNAGTTTLGRDASITASATGTGDGGKIIVWSNGLTTFLGSIEARGAAEAGNGGFAEVSGHHLQIGGHADLRAPNGRWGTLLFDPGTVTIKHGALGASVGTDVLVDADITDFLTNTGALVIDTEVDGAAGPSDITFDSSSGAIDITWNAPTKLTLSAGQNLSLAGNIAAQDGSFAPGSPYLELKFGQTVAGALSFNAVTINTSTDVSITGGAGSDTINGPSGGATFTTSGAGAGAISGPFAANYTSVQHLAGGGGNDTFNLNVDPGATVSTGGGTDLVRINVSLAAGSTLTGAAGTTFNLASGVTVADTITGGGTVVGPNNATTWGITGADAVTISVGATATLSGAFSLRGGTAADSFVFSDGATLSGTIAGGGGASANSLSFAAYTTARSVTLDAVGTNRGFKGHEAALNGGAANGFDNIDTITGGTGSDTLTGINSAGTWSLSGLSYTSTNVLGFSAFETLRAGSGGDTFDIDADFTGSLAGGAGSDTFAFVSTSALSGTIDGGSAGTDTLDFNGATAATDIALDGTGGAHGFRGHVSVLKAGAADGFTNITALVGHLGGGNQFKGAAATATWNLGASDVYTDGANSLTLTNFQNLIAGDGGDTFNINTNHTVGLHGGTGADSFVFGDAVVLTGALEGGTAGLDTLSFSGYTTARNVVLNGVGAAHGFSGTNAAISGTFDNITRVVGGSATDTLTGLNATSTWNLGANTYVSTNTLTFAGIENLVGGTGADTFVFADGATLAGTIDAGANSGTNTLDFSAYTTARAFVLDGLGTTRGFKGHEAAINGGGANGFDNIDALTGGTGTDSLAGLAAAAGVWNIAGTRTYVSTNTLTFSAIENLNAGGLGDTFNINVNHTGNLTGGAGSDDFVFANTRTVTGTIDGGSGGTDTLSFAAYNTARNVTLSALGTSHGFKGSEAAVTAFDDIDVLTGGSATDTLTGAAALAAVWNIGVTKTYVSMNTLTFSAFENLAAGGAGDTFNINQSVTGTLTGGAGNDSFVLASGVTAASIDGGSGGSDTLSFAAFGTARSITIAATLGTSHGFQGAEAAVTAFDDIDVLVGGSATDTLTGRNTASTWNLGASKTYVSGGRTLTYSALENLTAGTGGDTFNVSQNHSGNLTGGSGADTFNFSGAAVLTGMVDGAGASDALSFSGYATSVDVSPKGGSGKGDVSGVPDPIVGGVDDYDNIESVTGIATITAPNGQTNNWVVTGVDVFTLNGTSFAAAQVVGGDQIDNFTVNSGGRLTGGTGIDGSTGVNTLTTVAAGTFSITGANAGSLTTGGLTTTFTNIQTLIGGANADTFTFTGAFQVGSIQGNSGNDVINWAAFGSARTLVLSAMDATGATGTDTSASSSLTGTFSGIDSVTSAAGGILTAANQANTWAVNAADGGSLTSGGGTLAFTNFGTLTGGTSTDAVTFSGGGSLSGSVAGGTGTNTLSGDDTVNAWILTASNAGTLNGLSFTAFSSLTGGNTTDSFQFNGGSVTGNINGGAGGTNTLDYSLVAPATTLNVNLAAGTATSVGGSIGNINALTGNGANTTLVGPNSSAVYSVAAGGGSGTISVGPVSFTGVGSLQGGTGGGVTNTLSLAAAVADLTFTIAGTDDAGSVNTATPLAFSNMQNVTAGGGNDTFSFTGTGRITGTADGGAGTNHYDFSASPTPIAVDLGSLTNIQDVTGSAGADTLVGKNVANTFNITGNNSGNVVNAGGTVTFSSFEGLQGGTNADAFVFAAGAFTVVAIDGAGGSDTINWSNYGTTRDVSITALDANGADGLEAGSVIGGFANVETLIGKTGAPGQLTGPNAASTWSVTGANSGTLASGGGSVAFSEFKTLTGGTATDAFAFTGGGMISGSLSGGGTASGNTLTADNAANTWTMTNATDGSVATLGGTATFTGIGNLVGNAGNDTFDFPIGVTSLGTTTIDGGAGGTNAVHFAASGVTFNLALVSNLSSVDAAGTASTNTLVASNTGTTFNVSDLDLGDVNGGMTFTNFGSLTGGTGADSFVFTSAGAVHGRISGSIDGGGGAGVNVIDFSGSTLALKYTVGGTANSGSILDEALIASPPDVDLVPTFTNVQTVTGNGLGAIYGPDAGTQASTIWKITGVNSGTFGPTTGNENTFNNFLVVGGTSSDDFRFSSGGQIAGSIIGGGGTNKVTGAAAAANTWTLDSATGGSITVGGLTTNFSGIQTLLGGGVVDTFTPNASFTGNIDGGAGANTIDWSTSGAAHDVTLTALGTTVGFQGTVTGIGGGFDDITALVNPGAFPGTLTGANLVNAWTISGADTGSVTSGGRTMAYTNFANLAGGTNADTFAFTTGSQTGAVAGGSGTDTLDWSAFATGRTVVVTALDATGASGTEASIAGGFIGIESIANRTGAAGQLTGPNATNTWTINAANGGTLASGAGTLTFADFPTLVGGTDADSFVVTRNAAGTIGHVDGSSGTDTLSFAGNAGVASLTVTGSGTVDGVQGTEHFLATGFDNIDVAVGSAGTDTLTNGGVATATWAVGGSESFTVGLRTLAFSAIENLTGSAADDTFDVTGNHTGNLSGGNGNDTFNIGGTGTVLTGNLVGGTGNDTFVFTADARITGSVAGGAAGNDTLDWSASTSAVSLTITNLATLDQGDLSPLVGATGPGFTGIDVYVTNNSLSTIIGPNSNATWTINGLNTFQIVVGINNATFTNVGNLQGGSANDDFVFTAGGRLTGSINGGGGTNTITGDNVATSWTLTGATSGTITGAGTGLGGSFSGIMNVTGGSAGDTFVVVGASAFAGAIDGGLGTNTIQGGDVANTWHLNGANAGDIGGNSAFTNVSQLVGGGADDTFQFSGAAGYATLDGGVGTDRLDYSALAGPITVDLKNHTASLVTTAGGTTNVEALTGSASAADTLIADDVANTWTVTAANQGTLDSFAFTGVENLTGGAAADRYVISGAGVLVSGTMDGGAGTNELVGNGIVNGWNITGANAGTMNGNAFTNVQNLTAQGANATLAFGAVAGISGTFTAPQITLATANIDTGGTALNVQGNVVTAGVQSITAGAITIAGNVTSSGALTLTSAAAPMAITGALTGSAGLVASTGGGNFTLGGALTTSGTTTISTGGGAIVLGGAVDAHSGAFSAQAPAGSFTVGGAIAAGSVDIASANSVIGAVTTTGSQTYSGSTTFNGDLHGGNLVFNGNADIAGDVLAESSTNTWTFAGSVVGNGSLDINPTAGTDLLIDTTVAARHLSSTAFSGYHGHLIVGGILTPRTGPAEDARVDEINADRITVGSTFATHGDVTLLASNIDLLADLAATGGQVTMLAVGDTQGTGSASGDITGPTVGTVGITADKAVLIANNAIVNNQNIRLDLGGGPVLVAVSSSVQQPTFDPSSNATSQTFDPTALKIISSLTNPIGVQAVQVVFSNPAAALTGLQNVQFVDVGVFEQDLTLFGVLGNGIALSLDQCEDKDGCAPNVTMEELDKLIAGLKARLDALTQRGKGEGGGGRGRKDLVAEYERQLASFEGYKKQLQDYQEAQEESRKDDFEDLDVGGAKGKPPAPAANQPAPEEDFEEVEKPSATQPQATPKAAPAPAAPAAKPAEFEELDETFDDKPKAAPVQPAPAAKPAAKPAVPAPAAPKPTPAPAPKAAPKPAGKPAAAPGEFEELEEDIDDSFILSLADNADATPHGAVAIDATGRVRWQGELLLPAVHARY